MNVSGNDPIPLPDARLVGAYWLASAKHEDDSCMWCAQLRSADAPARRAPPEGKRSPAVWVVPPGLPPRPQPGR
jgi:hypothetical protein